MLAVFKSYSDVLLPVLTMMVNLSLQSATLPIVWKCAVVIPLLKKIGLELVKSNYRGSPSEQSTIFVEAV